MANNGAARDTPAWHQKYGNLSQIAVACAIIMTGYYYWTTVQEARIKVAADAVSEWNRHQSKNARQCLKTLELANDATLKLIFERKNVDPAKENIADDFVVSMKACLSDLQPNDIADKSGTLSAAGISEFANRVSNVLAADNLVALFALSDVGKIDLYKPIADAICRDDRKIMEQTKQTEHLRSSFGSIRKLLADKPFGECPKT